MHKKEIITEKEFKDFFEDYDGGIQEMEDDEDEDFFDNIKEFLVEMRDYSWGGGYNTIDDIDYEIEDKKIVVDVWYYDDIDNPDFQD